LDVSIIIVNYNTKDLLRDCLASIYEHTGGIAFEVIVSDNGSVDGSVEMIRKEFPRVAVIENNANLGFGAANNRGLDAATGKYVFYLNSDTVLLNNVVNMFYDFWETYSAPETLGALGCNLVDQQNNVIHSYGEFPNINHEICILLHNIIASAIKFIIFKLTGKSIQLRHNIKHYTGSVDYITGADLFLIKNENARFDERYFMYCEEVDLQYQLKSRGKERLLIDGPRIIHAEGGSEQKNKNLNYAKMSTVMMGYSKLIYFRKHGGKGFKMIVVKTLLLVFWLNPALYPMSRNYISKMLRV